jgi:hypothetical protein
MQDPIVIENIEEMRSQEGIDDVELRTRIRGLAVGDFVKLTFLTGLKTFETLLVRITRIKGSAFRGKLASEPACTGQSKLHVGTAVAFTTAHIHSVAKDGEARGK